jgi:hypothetical protein
MARKKAALHHVLMHGCSQTIRHPIHTSSTEEFPEHGLCTKYCSWSKGPQSGDTIVPDCKLGGHIYKWRCLTHLSRSNKNLHFGRKRCRLHTHQLHNVHHNPRNTENVHDICLLPWTAHSMTRTEDVRILILPDCNADLVSHTRHWLIRRPTSRRISTPPG